MSDDELYWLAAQLSLAFKIDYAEPDTTDNARCVQVWELARKQGMTRREFEDTIAAFLSTKPYPNWAPAEILAANRPPKVYPYAWYLERIEQNRASADAIGAYELRGAIVYGWKHEVGDRLVPVSHDVARERRSLPDKRPHMDPDTKAAFEEWREKTRRELAEEDPINTRPAAPLWNRDDQPFSE